VNHPTKYTQLGFGWLGWMLAIPIALVLLAVGYFIYCEMNKAYWDRKVKELCEHDGGIKVYENTLIPNKYISADNTIRIPTLSPAQRKPFDWEAKQDDEFYRAIEKKILRNNLVAIHKSTIKIVRSTDGKVLGEAVYYGRSGGDFPTGFSHPTHFICPKNLKLNEAVFELPKIKHGEVR